MTNEDIEAVLFNIIDEINKLTYSAVQIMTNGNCTSYEHYKMLSGKVKANQDCQEVVKNMIAKIKRGDV
jgi:hypothetical protein